MTQEQHAIALGIASRGGTITWTLIDGQHGKPRLLGKGQCARLDELRTLRDNRGTPLPQPNLIAAGCSSMNPTLADLVPGATVAAVDPVLAHLLTPLGYETPPDCPYLVLVATAKHTVLAQVDDAHHYRLLGHALDTSAGSVFDALALKMGMEAPGGPLLERLADFGNASACDLPAPPDLADENNLGFSFAPLRMAALARAQELQRSPCEQPRADLAAAVQEAVVHQIRQKVLQALQHTGLKQLALSGGVSRNAALRQALQPDCQLLVSTGKQFASTRVALALWLMHAR